MGARWCLHLTDTCWAPAVYWVLFIALSCRALLLHVDLGHKEPAGSRSWGLGLGATAGLAASPLLPPLPHWVSPALGPQILPQEEDYGFDIEEKNKAVVVKSVQRGSLAEVRLLRGATCCVGASSLLIAMWGN